MAELINLQDTLAQQTKQQQTTVNTEPPASKLPFIEAFRKAVDECYKGRNQLFLEQILQSTLLIIQYLETPADSTKRKEMDRQLQVEMANLKIGIQKNTTGTLMIAKAIFKGNHEQAKKADHYGIVAYVKGIKPTEEAVREFRANHEYGSPQNVWESWNKDGAKKKSAGKTKTQPVTPSTGGEVIVEEKASRQELISRGKFAVSDRTLYRAAPQTLSGVVKAPAVKKTFVIIAEVFPDLGFQMKAMIENESLLNEAYRTYGEKYVETDEQKAKRLEKLAQEKPLSVGFIREQAGDEIADECQMHWEAEKDTYDFFKDVPSGLKEYEDILANGDVASLRSKDGGEKFYETAIERLGELVEIGIDVDMYLDREFDPDTHLDAESVPRLLASKSQHNHKVLQREKQQDVFKRILLDKAKELREAKDDHEPTIDPKAHMARMAQMQDLINRTKAIV